MGMSVNTNVSYGVLLSTSDVYEYFKNKLGADSDEYDMASEDIMWALDQELPEEVEYTLTGHSGVDKSWVILTKVGANEITGDFWEPEVVDPQLFSPVPSPAWINKLKDMGLIGKDVKPNWYLSAYYMP